MSDFGTPSKKAAVAKRDVSGDVVGSNAIEAVISASSGDDSERRTRDWKKFPPKTDTDTITYLNERLQSLENENKTLRQKVYELEMTKNSAVEAKQTADAAILALKEVNEELKRSLTAAQTLLDEARRGAATAEVLVREAQQEAAAARALIDEARREAAAARTEKEEAVNLKVQALRERDDAIREKEEAEQKISAAKADAEKANEATKEALKEKWKADKALKHADEEERKKREYLEKKCQEIVDLVITTEALWTGNTTRQPSIAATSWGVSSGSKQGNAGDKALFLTNHLLTAIVGDKEKILELQKLQHDNQRRVEVSAVDSKVAEADQTFLESALSGLTGIEEKWARGSRSRLETLQSNLRTAALKSESLSKRLAAVVGFVSETTNLNLGYIEQERTAATACLKALQSALALTMDAKMGDATADWQTATTIAAQEFKHGEDKLLDLKEKMTGVRSAFVEFEGAGQALFGKTTDKSQLNSDDPTVFLPAFTELINTRQMSLAKHIESVLHIQKAIAARQKGDNKTATDVIPIDKVAIEEAATWLDTRLGTFSAAVGIGNLFVTKMNQLRNQYPVELQRAAIDNTLNSTQSPEAIVDSLTKFFEAETTHFVEVWEQLGKLQSVAEKVNKEIIKPEEVEVTGEPKMSTKIAKKPMEMIDYVSKTLETASGKLDTVVAWKKTVTDVYTRTWRGCIVKYAETQALYNRSSDQMTEGGQISAPAGEGTSSNALASRSQATTSLEKKTNQFVPVGDLTADSLSTAVTHFIEEATNKYEYDTKQKMELQQGLNMLSNEIGKVLGSAHLKDQVLCKVRIDTILSDLKPFITAMTSLIDERATVYKATTEQMADAYKITTGVAYSISPTITDWTIFALLTTTATKLKDAVKEKIEKDAKEVATILTEVQKFGSDYADLVSKQPKIPEVRDDVKRRKSMPSNETKDADRKERTEDTRKMQNLSIPVHAANDVTHALRNSLRYATNEAKRYTDFIADSEKKIEQVQKAVVSLSAETGQVYVASDFDKYAAIVGVIEKSTEVHKTLKTNTRDACVTLDKALGPIQALLETKAPIQSFRLIEESKFVANSIDRVFEEYREKKTNDDKAIRDLNNALLKLDASVRIKTPMASLTNLRDTGAILRSIDVIAEENRAARAEDSKAEAGTLALLEFLPPPFYDAVGINKADRQATQIFSVVNKLSAAILGQSQDLAKLHTELNRLPPDYLMALGDVRQFSVQVATNATAHFRKKLEEDQKELELVYTAATKGLGGHAVVKISSLRSYIEAVTQQKKKSEKSEKKKPEKKEGVSSSPALGEGFLSSAAPRPKPVQQKRRLDGEDDTKSPDDTSSPDSSSPDDGRKRRKTRRRRKRLGAIHTFWDIYSFAMLVSGRVNTSKDSDIRLLKLPLAGDDDNKPLIFNLALEIYRQEKDNNPQDLRTVVNDIVAGLARGAKNNDDDEDGDGDDIKRNIAAGYVAREANRISNGVGEIKNNDTATKKRFAVSSEIADPVFNLVNQFRNYDAMIRDGQFTEVVKMVVMSSLVTALSEIRMKLDLEYYYSAFTSSRVNEPVSFEEMMCTEVINTAIVAWCCDSINTLKAQNPNSFVATTALQQCLLQEKSTFDHFRATFTRNKPFDWTVFPYRTKASLNRRPRSMRIGI